LADENRFGTKMLEKMGWTKGNGLGAKQDGEKDFVRIRFKNDAEGLGFEARDDQWTTHEEGFNGLLKSLNGEENEANGKESEPEEEARPMGFGFKAEEPEEPSKKKLKENTSGMSLEERSKQSRARVHYKKFTRGKDLSQYSEKDLANIFGKKATDDIDAPAPVVVEEPKEEKIVDANFAGVQTVSTGLSVSDYFKHKMEAFLTGAILADTSGSSSSLLKREVTAGLVCCLVLLVAGTLATDAGTAALANKSSSSSLSSNSLGGACSLVLTCAFAVSGSLGKAGATFAEISLLFAVAAAAFRATGAATVLTGLNSESSSSALSRKELPNLVGPEVFSNWRRSIEGSLETACGMERGSLSAAFLFSNGVNRRSSSSGLSKNDLYDLGGSDPCLPPIVVAEETSCVATELKKESSSSGLSKNDPPYLDGGGFSSGWRSGGVFRVGSAGAENNFSAFTD